MLLPPSVTTHDGEPTSAGSFPLPPGTVTLLRLGVLANARNGEAMAWVADYSFLRVGLDPSSRVGVGNKVSKFSSVGGITWDFDIVADGDGFRVDVTGEADKTIDWAFTAIAQDSM